jgi:metal-dependent hydrolase (beta-lactamase superfamily II)
VAKKKVSELSKEINHLVRTSNAFLQNQKRVKVDVERIDAIVFKTIKDLPDLSALKQATDKYVPLKVAREKALEVMNKTSKELEETSLAMSSERTTHRDIVEELKREIKRTKADIQAITSCNHLMQTSFEKTVTERSSSRADEMKTKRRALEDEIGALEIELRDATTVHKANLLALENNRADLSQQLEATKHKTTVAMKQLEVRFDELQLEHADHSAALDYLRQRQSVEAKKVEAAKAQEMLRAEKKAQIKAREEKEHYAALWIQLRWKAHVRRQLQKLAASKGKKKGGKKKGKK